MPEPELLVQQPVLAHQTQTVTQQVVAPPVQQTGDPLQQSHQPQPAWAEGLYSPTLQFVGKLAQRLEQQHIREKAVQMGFHDLPMDEKMKVDGNLPEVAAYRASFQSLHDYDKELNWSIGERHNYLRQHMQAMQTRMRGISEEAVVSALRFGQSLGAFDRAIEALPAEKTAAREKLLQWKELLLGNDRNMTATLNRYIASRSGPEMELALGQSVSKDRGEIIQETVTTAGAGLAAISCVRVSQAANLERLARLPDTAEGEALLERMEALRPMMACADHSDFMNGTPQELATVSSQLLFHFSMYPGVAEMMTAQFTSLSLADYGEEAGDLTPKQLRKPLQTATTEGQELSLLFPGIYMQYAPVLHNTGENPLTQAETAKNEKRHRAFADQVDKQLHADLGVISAFQTWQKGMPPEQTDSFAAVSARFFSGLIDAFQVSLPNAALAARDQMQELYGRRQTDDMDDPAREAAMRRPVELLAATVHNFARLSEFAFAQILKLEALERNEKLPFLKHRMLMISRMLPLCDKLESMGKLAASQLSVSDTILNPDVAGTLCYQAGACLQAAVQLAENRYSDQWTMECDALALLQGEARGKEREAWLRAQQDEWLDIHQGPHAKSGDLEHSQTEQARWTKEMQEGQKKLDDHLASTQQQRAAHLQVQEQRDAFLRDASLYRQTARHDEEKERKTAAQRILLTRQREQARQDRLLREEARQASEEQMRALWAQREQEAKRQREIDEVRQAREREAYAVLERQQEQLRAKEQALQAEADRLGLTLQLDRQVQEPPQSSTFAQVCGRLALYIPKDAAGKLADYRVGEKTEKGVGKGTVTWEKLCGGIGSSKLSQRIGLHVKRFLYSDQITAAHIGETAMQVVTASGLFSQKHKAACQKQNLLRDDQLRADKLGPAAEPLNLLEQLQRTPDLAGSADILAHMRRLLAGDPSLVSLEVSCVRQTPARAQTVSMYLLARQAADHLKSLPAHQHQQLRDRVLAITENLEPLYGAIVRSPEYQRDLKLLELDTVQLQLRANMAQFNQLQPLMAKVLAPRTILDNEEAYVTQLHLERDFAVVQTVEARDMALQQEAEIRRLQETQRAYDADRDFRRRELDAMRAERFALAQQRDRAASLRKKEALLQTGKTLSGEQTEGWLLGSRQELVRKALGERFLTDSPTRVQQTLLQYNHALRANLAAVDSYLDEMLLRGGDFGYLCNASIRAIAAADLQTALDVSLLELQTQSTLHQRLADIARSDRAKQLFADYRAAVRAVQAHVLEDRDLAPYAQAITADPKHLDILTGGSKAEIRKLLSDLKQSLAFNQGIVDQLCQTLEPSLREDAAQKLKEKLGVQLISASAVSVEASVRRALDHLQLLHPQVSRFGKRLDDAAAEAGACDAVVQVFCRRSKALADSGTPAQLCAALRQLQQQYDAGTPLLEGILSQLLSDDRQKLDWQIAKQAKKDVAHGVESTEAKVLQLRKTLLSQPDATEAARQFVRSRLTASLADAASKRELTRAAQALLDQYLSDLVCQQAIARAQEFAPTTAAAANVYEQTIQNGLLRHPGLGQYLQPNAPHLLACIRRQMAVDRPSSIESAAQLTRLRVPQVYDYLSVLQVRLSLLVPVLQKHPEYCAQETVVQTLLEIQVRGEHTAPETLTRFAQRLYLDSMAQANILADKDLILSMGECWQSRRAFVNFYDQQINTSGKVQFRAVNRIARMRQAQLDADAFAQEPPVSFYAFCAQNYQLTGKETHASLRGKWLAQCERWAGKDKQRKEFIANLTGSEHLELYYGLNAYTSTVLKGVGDSINRDDRKDYEKKLLQVGMQLAGRLGLLRSYCAEYQLSQPQSQALEKNMEDQLVDSDRDIAAAMDRLIEEDRQRLRQLGQPDKPPQSYDRDALRQTALAKLDSQFQVTVLQNVQAWSQLTRKLEPRPQAELQRISDLEQLVMRKDQRCRAICAAEDGIFTPLLPVLLARKEYSDIVVAGTDEAFSQMVRTLSARTRAAMRLLTQPSSVFYSFLDQYLHDFADAILSGEITEENAVDHFTRHYTEILATFDFNPKNQGAAKPSAPPISIQTIFQKAMGAAARDALQSDDGNLITLISLYEGVLAISDQEKLRAYRQRLQRNRAVLQEELAQFTATAEFATYAKLDDKMATGLANQGQTRAEALRETFRESMHQHEREFLVLTADPELYRAACRQRLETMLRVSREQLATADFLAEKHRETADMAATSILAEKQAGRAQLQAERDACAPYLELAARKISPLQAAGGMQGHDPPAAQIPGVAAGQAAALGGARPHPPAGLRSGGGLPQPKQTRLRRIPGGSAEKHPDGGNPLRL